MQGLTWHRESGADRGRFADERLLDQLGELAQLELVGVARGLDRVLIHRDVLGTGDDEQFDVREGDGLADAVFRGAFGAWNVGDPDASAAGAAAEAVVAVAWHLDERAAKQPDDLARIVVLAVDPPEVAGVVVGDAVAERFVDRERAGAQQFDQQLRVVDDGPARAELRVFVAQRVERVRIGGHDPVELAALDRADVVGRERFEQALLPTRRTSLPELRSPSYGFRSRRRLCAAAGRSPW